jgi:hypothetical protein
VPRLHRSRLLVLLGALTVLLPVMAVPASASDAYDGVIDITYPVNGPVDYVNDYHNGRSGGRAHRATDLGRADAYGLPVHAAMGGTVTFITGMSSSVPSYGYMISIAGDDGRTYNYIHLGRQDGPPSEAYAEGIRKGSRVARGQHIGYVGHSGNASASWPHLHFEIEDDAITDPYGSNRRNPYHSLVAAQNRGDVPGAATMQGVPDGAVPVPGDWNGDGRTQPGWFHEGHFYLPAGNRGQTISFRYGRAGDAPVAGDWNGTGRDGVGVFRNGRWYLRNALSSGPSWRHFRYGRAGDQPVAGDWNRTGRDGIGVFRDGRWFVRNPLSGGPSWRHWRYGRAGDTAITGDWLELGRDGVGVVRDGQWYVRGHLNGGRSHYHYSYGRPTDLPIAGDWNGSGGATSGIVRNHQWRLTNHMPARAPDMNTSYTPSSYAPS